MLMASRGTPAWKNAAAIRYGVQGSCGPGFSTKPTCIGMTGSQSVWTPGEFEGKTKPSTGVTVSYQAQSPVLGLVLPSNSPGVHTLWLPVIPMQVGLVLKPGPQEPWT